MKRIASLTLIIIMLMMNLASCGFSASFPHSHSFGEWTVAKEPTCIEDGSRVRTCRCGESESEAIAALGHSTSDWIIDKEATCKETGSRHTECTRCGNVVETVTVGTLTTHTPSEPVRENEVDGTCEKSGSYDSVVYCSVCDLELSRESKTIAKKEHTTSDWITDTAATCEEAGSRYTECTVCHTVLNTEVIPKLTTHTPSAAVTENKVDATCEKSGSYDSVVYCSVCDLELSRESKTIAKKEHTTSDWITDKDPTYTEEGACHKECTVCGEVLESESIPKLIPETYTVSYSAATHRGEITVSKVDSFTLPVIPRSGFTFLGYYEGDVQVTDATGKKLASYTLTSDVTLTAKYTRLAGDADANGEYLGNPGEAYYKSTSFTHKMARNPWDMALLNGKLYVSGGYYGGSWISAPPIYTYDTFAGEWGYADFTVKMYEALDADSTAKAWHELHATSSSSDNVVGGIKGIPVTTDCEISSFKWIGGKLYALGADTINGNTWADGTVSSKLPTDVDANDTQKSVPNNLGNYYTVETDESGNDVWVEYRNNILNGTHVYDVIEIDYNGGKALMFAVGTSGTPMPVKILTNPATKSYLSPKFYLKDGTVYLGNSNNRVYNFFKTDEGIFAFYAHQGGTAKKIFKYNVVNGEHRFDEVRDITINATTSDTANYQQSDVNSSGTAISTRRLYTDFMKTESYNGYAYYTTGYLYKTKTFVTSETTKIAAPNGAIITDLLVRDGVLYALGFKKTNSTTNAYTNYVWSLDSKDAFTEIRSFTSTGAYALSFEKDEDFFYVGLGGPTTHITTTATSVGDIVRLAIDPIN